MSRGPGPKSILARADLLRALADADLLNEAGAARPQAQEIGELLGFGWTRPRPSPALPSGAPAPPERPALPRDFDVPLWRVEAREFTDDDERQPPPPEPKDRLERAELGRPREPPPEPEPPSITSWSRLRRALEQVWRRPRPIGGVDVDALVRSASRGAPIVRMPREARAVPVNRLIVILDRSERLLPVWTDQVDVLRRIRREFGAEQLLVASWRGGPPRVLPPTAEGDAVLVLGDLGHYGGPAQRGAWARVGFELCRRGVDPTALMPVPAARWEPALIQSWRPIDWSKPTRGRARVPLDPEALIRRRDQLLALLSWTVRTEPELVREVRSWLPATGFDLGTELDLWNHPELGRHSCGLLIPTPLRRGAWARLRAREGDSAGERLAGVAAIVRRRHACLAQEIWIEEARTLELLGLHEGTLRADERERVRMFTRRVAALFDPKDPEREALASLGEDVDLTSWAARSLEQRVPERGWSHPELGPELRRTFNEVTRDRKAATRGLPPGFDVGMLDELGPEQAFEVRQRGSKLLVAAAGQGTDRGSPLLRVVTRGRSMTAVPEGQSGAMAWALNAEGEVELAMPAADTMVIAVHGERAIARLRPTPSWACASGRDRFGCWAAFRVGEVEQRMRWIPPGRFWMGSPNEEVGRIDREGPQHLVTLTHGFWLGETPCTQELWEAVTGEQPSQFKGAKRPVESISWDEIDGEFLQALGRLFDSDDSRFRLPTEAEWEYACRAGTTTATHAGDLVDADRDPTVDALAWYAGNSEEQTHPVARKRPNGWGLYDMLGNVYEWCADGPRIPYLLQPSVNPCEHGPDRVYRGGSWAAPARFARAAFRYWYPPGCRFDVLGFRLARGQELRSSSKQAENQQATRKQGRKRGRGTRPA